MDSMQGKVCLITGATGGIGRVTALELARRGATVVGVGRHAEKCRRAAEQIRRTADNPHVAYLVADLSALGETRRVAMEFLDRYDRLDVLINNVGGYFSQFQETVDGIELTIALNLLSPFLLTHCLLDRLKASAPARIINVSSDAHRKGEIRFADLEGRRRYAGWFAYMQSKLGDILFTHELARRLAGSGVTANALHPGFVNTNFAHSSHGLFAYVIRIAQKLIAISPEQGAQTQVYLASSPAVATVSGEYFEKSQPAVPARAAQDPATAAQLWEWAEQMVQPYLEDRGAPAPGRGAVQSAT